MYELGRQRGQKRVLGLLELVIRSSELTHGCWELNPGSSETTVSALNHSAISPAPRLLLLNKFLFWL